MGEAAPGDNGVGSRGDAGDLVQIFKPPDGPLKGAGNAGDRIVCGGIGGGDG